MNKLFKVTLTGKSGVTIEDQFYANDIAQAVTKASRLFYQQTEEGPTKVVAEEVES